MSDIFIKIFNLSVTAGWLVLAVLLLRPLMKKAPKWINCLLWGIVGLRLVFPFSLESIFSLIPSAEPLPPDIMMSPAPAINSGVGVLNDAVNPIISTSLAPAVGASVNPAVVQLYPYPQAGHTAFDLMLRLTDIGTGGGQCRVDKIIVLVQLVHRP